VPADYPAKLARLIRLVSAAETRSDRVQLLIDLARRYHSVPERIAVPPYPEEHQVPGCDSRVYVFFEERPDSRLNFHFEVENPHGISAKALAVIIGETLSGAPLGQIATISTDVVYDIFGSEISMGKSMGLQGMVGAVVEESKRRAGWVGS
jgi:cysteine desulfuration protein SufE